MMSVFEMHVCHDVEENAYADVVFVLRIERIVHDRYDLERIRPCSCQLFCKSLHGQPCIAQLSLDVAENTYADVVYIYTTYTKIMDVRNRFSDLCLESLAPHVRKQHRP